MSEILLTYLLTYINSHNANALLREKIQLQELYKNIYDLRNIKVQTGYQIYKL